MANAKHDDNRVTSALAWDTTNSTPKNLLIDPVTGRLLIDVTLVASHTATVPTSVKRDDNRKPSLCATTDNASASVVPLLVEESTNYLLVDLILG